MESLEHDRELERKAEVDKVLVILCFLIFALVGYVLIRCLRI